MRGGLALLLALFALSACGRSPVFSAPCRLDLKTVSLDLGSVKPGEMSAKSLVIGNDGHRTCVLTQIALSADSDHAFSIKDPTLVVGIPPGRTATLTVVFSPHEPTMPPPDVVSGALEFRTNSADHPSVHIPLTGTVLGVCKISVSSAPIDFGHVRLGGSAMRTVQVTDDGTAPCDIEDVALGPMSDPAFALARGDAGTHTLAPGEVRTLSVTFSPNDPAEPHHRIGTLSMKTTDPSVASATIPLSGDIDIGCSLVVTPDHYDFGNVMLNTTVMGSVVLSNDGSDPCDVTNIALDPRSDHEFALASGTPHGIRIPPGMGGRFPIGFGFSAFDSAPPHLKTGTLTFSTGNPRAPTATVPLSAFINTACVEASRWIYTLEAGGQLARFDPTTLMFTDIGTIDCPTGDTPNSMAIDQNADAWVGFHQGGLFKVDTTNAHCTATSFVPRQHGLVVFGMGFVFEPRTGLDTLFIAGGPTLSSQDVTLATISFPSLQVTPVGRVTSGFPELTGTGDGELWGFMPSTVAVSGMASLVRLDPSNGATIETHTYANVPNGGDWAVKFWGGSFWIFLGTSVSEVKRAAPDILTVRLPDSGRMVLGAGVSTCAPLH